MVSEPGAQELRDSTMVEQYENTADRVIADQANDSYVLQSADHPGLILINVPLNGENYLSSSRAMIIALQAKDKLGFINDMYTRLAANSLDFHKWCKVDSTVNSWILNTFSKEIVEAFLYSPSAKDLWEELKQHFSDSNGPLLFQFKKDIDMEQLDSY